MPTHICPRKLAPNNEIRVIAPSRSPKIISQGTRDTANKRFAELGLRVSFGKHVEEIDDFCSSSIAHCVEDLHEATEAPA